MRAVLRDRGSVWGGLVLFRPSGEPDFTDADLALVAEVGSELVRGLRRCLLHSEHLHRDDPEGPGVAVLSVLDGSQIHTEMVSRAARRWLEGIPDGRIQPSGLPLTVLTLVHRALGSAGGSARTQVRTRSGRWLTLHVELADGGAADAGPPPPSGRVSPPHELAEVIADAYGLTPREREVARLVVAGHTNREISSTLLLSAYTVQDHLKAVYAKLGVRNRSELAARMFLDQVPAATGRRDAARRQRVVRHRGPRQDRQRAPLEPAGSLTCRCADGWATRCESAGMYILGCYGVRWSHD